MKHHKIKCYTGTVEVPVHMTSYLLRFFILLLFGSSKAFMLVRFVDCINHETCFIELLGP